MLGAGTLGTGADRVTLGRPAYGRLGAAPRTQTGRRCSVDHRTVVQMTGSIGSIRGQE